MRLLIILLLFIPRILGAQGSDECGTAQPIVLSTFGSVDVLVDNSSATNNPGDPPATGTLCPQSAFGDMVSDVWFSWNAPENGSLELNTCPGNLDTDIVVYRSNGGCGALVEIACNGDGVLPGGEICDSFGSILDGVGVVSGMSYLIRVGGWDDESIGSTIMTVNFQDQIVPPANLTCGYEASLGSLDLTWQNYVDYDSINLYVEGNFVGELDGVSAGFQTESSGFLAPFGLSSVCIEGVLNGITIDLVCCSIYIPEPCPSSVQIVLSPYQTIPPLVNCVRCEGGGVHADNSYLRSFDLKNDYGIQVGFSSLLSFYCVSTFATSEPGVVGQSQPVRVRLYVDEDGGDLSNLDYVSGATVNQTPNPGNINCYLFYEEEFQVGQFSEPTEYNFILGTGIVDPDSLGAASRSIDLTAFTPGSKVVVEIYAPDGQPVGHSWLMSTSSNTTEIGESYIAAVACGLNSPVSLSGIGFPDNRYVVDVGLSFSGDSDGDGIPDECDVDITGGDDCDTNGQDDSCQFDTDLDGAIDSCDPDIDGDGLENECDIDQNTGADCDLDGQLDSCQVDSDLDGIIDPCDSDLDGDGVVNGCDVDQEVGEDCDSNGVIDLCQLDFPDDFGFPEIPDSTEYALYFDTSDDAFPGSSMRIRCLLDNPSGPLAGWSLSVCEDLSENDYNMYDAYSGLAAVTANGGSPAAFDEVTLCPGGIVSQGVVVDFVGINSLPVGIEHELLLIDINVLGEAGSTSVIQYCSTSVSCGGGFVETLVVPPGGSSPIVPEQFMGEFTVGNGGNGGGVDCNNNLILDSCEIATGSASDCDGNGVIDDCEYGPETDCNSNGLLDSCDIIFGVSTDCNQNSTPDDCEVLDSGNDCDSNQILDECELVTGDCNQNGLLDICEVVTGTVPDCNANLIPDICEFSVLTDCNNNGILDECDILIGLSEDCNQNLIPDECDLVSGDLNTNGIPDDCEGSLFIRGDVNGDSAIDIGDAVAVLAYLFTGGSIDCEKSSDSNDDGAVNVADGIQILGYLFSGSGDPPAPFPNCGNDPSGDSLSCDSYPGC